MKRLLIASSGNPEALAERFRATLPDYEILTQAPGQDADPVPYVVAGKPGAGVFAATPGIKAILSLNAGVEHLIANPEIAADVPIVRLVDQELALGMSEWVLAEILAWHRNLGAYQDAQAITEWTPLKEKLARDRTITVLGAGALGRPVVEHLVRFGFNTRVWSRTGREIDGARAFAGQDGLAEAVEGADVLVTLLPLTAETENLIDAKLLGRLADGAFVVNPARGAQIVDDDLIAALDSGKLSGAALDVFRTEPLPADHPFWRHPKILVSPHVAAPTHADSAVTQMTEAIRRHERGDPLPHLVDRDAGY